MVPLDLGAGHPCLVGLSLLCNIATISFAPHADTRILTAGDDCKLRYWDLRNPGQPLLELGGHRHWVWHAAYNPAHDSLVASCSSDCCVNLYYTPQLAASAGAAAAAAPGGEAGAVATPGAGHAAPAGPKGATRCVFELVAR
ncbi:hypothetical protein CHLRE_02g109150v5 [Chlamydomonas reinhardtii]|uniref:EIPR1-like beta-propeller domain-containing protein n=1 Tax=Chlamydomonas reinhardtii TaxID=3055 RepID=A0A2K3E2V4_CHLRE|nr:uncharacterized protein CHLRE_02g109150v5 [Chlamydomonas reinhardtii]PNW87103.1 hypothetical protein CHLRE_02g109150v5 [Chlamydomonas reinhardtii]